MKLMTGHKESAPRGRNKTMKRIKNLITPSKRGALSPRDDDLNLKSIKKAMHNLNQHMSGMEQRAAIPFEEFLNELVADPTVVIRNVFQVFHDMMKAYVGEGLDEYSDDPESIHYVHYDCSELFVEGSDHPFFADRLFA